MIAFDAGAALKVISGLRILEQSLRNQPSQDDTPIDEVTRLMLQGDIAELSALLVTLGAKMTIAAVEEFEEFLNKEDIPVFTSTATRSVQDIAVTFRRELSLRKTFCIEPHREQFFAPVPGSYAPDFDVKFPAAIYETDEAGKCLALGRSTATVFHLMRAMEIGIKAVARCLGVQDPTKDHERSWGKILETIKLATEAKNKAGWSNKDDKQFFADVYVSLDAVRVAWRNTTMHVENKYTGDEAEHIFMAARGLMRKLTARLDEAGKPVA